MTTEQNPSRRDDGTTRNRLDEIQAGYLQWSRWTLWILIGIVVVQLGLGVVAVVLWQQIEDKFHQSLVIQCLDRNARHDETIVRLNKLITESDEVPAGAKDQVRQQNTVLIDAILPKYKDCEKRADVLEG